MNGVKLKYIIPMKGISQPRQLTITGLALPYLVIATVVVIILIAPGVIHSRSRAVYAIVAIALTFLTAIVGAVLVGIGSIKQDKLEAKRKSLIHAFLFGFVWTAIFHIFITIYFIMRFVVTCAVGLRY